MSEIAAVWFEESKKLEVGQAIFIRAADKKEQTQLARDLEEQKEIYSSIDAVHASQIFVNKVLKEMKQYVVLERKYRAPFTAFLRDENGSFSKLTVDPDRKRIIRLMLKDGKPKSEIEETLNGLTDEELATFFL